MFPTQARKTCDSTIFSDGFYVVWCLFLFFAVGLAIINAIFAAVTAFLIRRDVVHHPVNDFAPGMDPMEMNIVLAGPVRLTDTS
ncbi:hypothetical protein M413DRAFT_27615 [Hebeloma cylindrosporum]|uniref:Uncharacterized protein n=1 Tax=Hebeloma cylindrosporum TaxID=76867 RepID=A0A0C2YJM4_HEBCY|nr:hypothetical protein M413DRAFT_27615 [Hebeloma cylindrosporum h7]